MLRLFQRQKTLTWLVYGTLLAIFLSYLINIIVVPAQCRPIQKIWDPSLPGNCWGPNVQIDTSYLQGAAAALIDLMLAFLPIYFLWDVQISTRVKLGICCLTGLGVFTAACAIGRTVLTSNVKGPDVSFDALNLTVWGVLEQTFAIIAACIPALRPLFISITQSFGTTFGFSTKKPSAYHSDGATRNRFVPLKSIHPTEGAFPSRHERQGNVSAKGSDSDNLSEQDLVSPLSDDHGGIRKTTQIRVTDY
ncbi:MAG: hypothetical protein MMC33_005667 [Icmadophila ericetorum]|nr:hypothetical protein [Icmadophila ericetorum]